MKLKEYLEKLNKLAEENPMLLTLDVITSKDDEGNGFNQVHYDPQPGFFTEEGEFQELAGECNAICLN